MRTGDGSRLAEAGGPGGFWIDNPDQACNLELTNVVYVNLTNFWVGVRSVLADRGFNRPTQDFADNCNCTASSMLGIR
jgi:hypothetical protein